MEVVANKPERKKGHEERYEAVLQRIRERQAKLAAEGGVEAQKESSLLRSLPQFNLVLRSYVLLRASFIHLLNETSRRSCAGSSR